MNPAKRKGNRGEEIAARYLQDRGYQIVGRNYNSRYGEIDIIAADVQYIVFVEVKLRKANAMVSPLEAVSRAKQRRIFQTALCYLAEFPTERQPRFDIIEILEPADAQEKTYRLRRIQNAFSLEAGDGIF